MRQAEQPLVHQAGRLDWRTRRRRRRAYRLQQHGGRRGRRRVPVADLLCDLWPALGAGHRPAMGSRRVPHRRRVGAAGLAGRPGPRQHAAGPLSRVPHPAGAAQPRSRRAKVAPAAQLRVSSIALAPMPSYRVPDIAAGMGERPARLGRTLPKRAAVAATTVPAPAATASISCGSEEGRIGNYAQAIAKALGVEPSRDLQLFDGAGQPTPNLLPVMVAMSAIELGYLHAGPELVERAIDRLRVRIAQAALPAAMPAPDSPSQPSSAE